jgi:predicted negative regulator of RcsB-dependent stress response
MELSLKKWIITLIVLIITGTAGYTFYQQILKEQLEHNSATTKASK